jgi:hypothetical protein
MKIKKKNETLILVICKFSFNNQNRGEEDFEELYRRLVDVRRKYLEKNKGNI